MNQNPYRVLIVEDETELAIILKEYLESNQFKVDILADGENAVATILQNAYDMVLLDLMLPGKDGLAICTEVRQSSQVPIIMLTAKVEEVDRLIGLRLGADDYVCKPYSPREVVARVEAVLRRSSNTVEPSNQEFKFDQQNLQIFYKNQSTNLTQVEGNLLNALLSKPIRIHSRNDLMDIAYADNRIVNDRTIDSHINKLRKKIKLVTEQDNIRSIYGAGYKLELP